MTTATITDIQAALKEAIEAAAGEDPSGFALPISARIADSSVTKPTLPTDSVDVLIGFEANALLGRTNNLRLEQFLVPINLRARNADGGQSRFGKLHLVAQQMRDLLASHHTDVTRVEQLLSPHPFDQPAALVAGQFDHRFTLDMDVLRTITTSDSVEPPDPLPLLTKSREAVWNAINNWPPFTLVDESSTWVRRFSSASDIEELSLHDPAAHELPAIAVTWGPVNPEWWVNVMQNWAQQLFITFWLPSDQLNVAEQRAVELMQAAYQSKPEGDTMSYIRRAVGRPPTKNAPITIEPVELGRSQQLKAWRGTIALTLTGLLDPNS